MHLGRDWKDTTCIEMFAGVFVFHVRSELSSEAIRKAQLLPGEADTHAQNNLRPRDDNTGCSGL